MFDASDDSVLRHPHPTGGEQYRDGCREVAVDLTAFDMEGQFELLWVAKAEGAPGFVVNSLPFLCYGIQFGDRVELDASEEHITTVLERCGLRTMRVAFVEDELAEQVNQARDTALRELGLPHEWQSSGYVSILIRNIEDQQRAYEVFEADIDCEKAEWEVDPEPFVSNMAAAFDDELVARHASPHINSTPGGVCHEVVVELADYDWEGHKELLWVAPTDNGYTVRSIPFFVTDIQLGDCVELNAEGVEIANVVEAGEWTTMRIAYRGDATASQSQRRQLSKLDLPHEWISPAFVVVALRDDDEFDAVYAIFEAHIEDELADCDVHPMPE